MTVFLRGLFALNAVLLVALVSAVWREWDLYRFALPFLLLEGILLYYLRADRPSIGLMGYACGLWGLHVVLRMVLTVADGGSLFGGSSEGVYIFAMVYPTLGYALYVHRRHWRAYALLFVAISFLALVASVDLPAVTSGVRVDFLFHHNTIHASIGGGFIVLATFGALFHLWATPGGRPWLRAAASLVGIATVGLALFGILGAKSKGVWLSLALALPVFFLILVLETRRRATLPVAFASLVVVIVGTAVFWQPISQELRPNAEAAFRIASDLSDGTPPEEALTRAIEGGLVPPSFEQRLQLWASAADVWGRSVLVGSGVDWFSAWAQTPAADMHGALIHNGYLEIAVRYGILGLLFYGATLGWSGWQTFRAYRERLVPAPVLATHVAGIVFFLATLVTNSNNRLGIGESFMLFSGAFGFFCYFLRADARTSGRAPA